MQNVICECDLGHADRRPSASYAHWLLTAALWHLMPKCRLCLAGYAIAISGFSFPMVATTPLRWPLTAICLMSLLYLVIKSITDENAGCGCSCGDTVLLHQSFEYPDRHRP